MSGLYEAGGVIGTMLLPMVADRWGRKWACAAVGYNTKKNVNANVFAYYI
jgi:hypothetical protein